MSVTGIAGSILAAVSGSQNNYQIRSQQIQSEFQQLGQDLQSGNLAQAQSDFTTLSQNLPGANQSASTSVISPTSSTGAPSTSNSLAQTFAQLGQDLQSGKLQAAQQDYTTIQQDVQQNAGQQVGRHHHHHHHAESLQGSSSSSSQQTNPLVQAFSQLAQTLLAGNLQRAQSAFATLQNDLQQIGGFIPPGSSSTASSTAPITAGNLNVTV